MFQMQTDSAQPSAGKKSTKSNPTCHTLKPFLLTDVEDKESESAHHSYRPQSQVHKEHYLAKLKQHGEKGCLEGKLWSMDHPPLEI